jgi:hypothetical protein
VKEELSSTEFVIGGMASMIACITWGFWYRDLIKVNRLGERGHARLVLASIPILSLLIVFLTLLGYAAEDVRGNSTYLALYTLLGAASIGLIWKIAPWFGIIVRDDLLERKNSAALTPAISIILCGAIMYAGANIGEGPGVYAVMASVGLAISSWLVLWRMYEQFTKASEKITIERNHAAGVKLSALLVANAVTLGGAAAGDWIPGEVLTGFWGIAVFAVGLTCVATLLDRKVKGYWPACFYVLLPLVGYFSILGRG